MLAAVLLGAGLAGFTRARTHAAAPADFIIAATATANEPAPALPPDIVQTLRSAGLGKTPATAYVVAPGASQPDTISLTPHLPNGQVDYGPTRNSTMTANISAVQQAVEREAAQGPFDLLATLAAAIRAAPAPATLIVVSSGLSTSGGFDLRQVGWDASPGSVAAQLKARGLLPDLAGYQVLFSGLGDTAGRQRRPPAAPANHPRQVLGGDLPGQRRGLLQRGRHRPARAALTQHHPGAPGAGARGDQRDRPPAQHDHVARHAAVPVRQLHPRPLRRHHPGSPSRSAPAASTSWSRSPGTHPPTEATTPTTSPCRHGARTPSVTVSSPSACPPAKPARSPAPAPPGRAGTPA